MTVLLTKHVNRDNRKIMPATTAANTPLFKTTRLEHETPQTIGAGECVDSVYRLALRSLDDHLFICFESTAAWWGNVTYPHIYSLCQVGIKVINASFDRCWKVSLKHERTSTAGITTHSVMFTSLSAHVSTLYGFIFKNSVHDILWTVRREKINIKQERWKREMCPLHLNINVWLIATFVLCLFQCSLVGMRLCSIPQEQCRVRAIYLATCFVTFNMYGTQCQMFSTKTCSAWYQHFYPRTPGVPQCSTYCIKSELELSAVMADTCGSLLPWDLFSIWHSFSARLVIDEHY